MEVYHHPTIILARLRDFFGEVMYSTPDIRKQFDLFHMHALACVGRIFTLEIVYQTEDFIQPQHWNKQMSKSDGTNFKKHDKHKTTSILPNADIDEI